MDPFLQSCQNKLNHALPLSAYLLKPIQRLTKYQLLIEQLVKYNQSGRFSNTVLLTGHAISSAILGFSSGSNRGPTQQRPLVDFYENR